MENDGKWLPIFYAAKIGDVKAVESLMACTEDVAIKMEITGQNALHIATTYGHENVVKLLCKNKKLLHMKDRAGRTPLFTAVSKGHVQIVEILCQHGSSVHDRIRQNYTPLLLAIFENNPEIVAILLNHGAIATRRHNRHISPFKVALQNNYQTIVQLLLHSTDLLDICSCPSYPDPEFAEEIFNHCLRKKSAEDCLSGKKILYNYTALNFAVQYDRYYQVKRLVESGMDVNRKATRTLKTPLHQAVNNRNIIIVEYLLTKMADVNAVDYCGTTPLHSASRYWVRYLVSEKENFEDGLKIIKILLKNGASVNTFDNDAKTPLHYAVIENKFRLEKVRLLLDHNAEVDAHLNGEQTPIFYAENAAIVKILIDRGADVNYMMTKDRFTITPLYHAIQEKNVEKVELLLENGADMSLVPISKNLFIVQHGFMDDIFQTDTEINEVIIDRLRDITPIIKILIKDRFDDRNIIPLLAKRLFQGDVTIDLEKFSSVSNTLSLIFYECQMDLKRMRDEFKVFNLSLFDFLIMPMKKLRSYMTNEEVLKVLWSGNIIEDEFPVYSNMIMRRFKKAKEERDLLDTSSVALQNFIFNHHKIHLPDLVVYKIIDLLDVLDWKSLAQLLKCVRFMF